MTPEERLNRLERVAKLFVRAGMRAREQSRKQNERINVLIHMSERDRQVRQAESHELNEKINILVNSQMDLSSTVKDLAAMQSEGRTIHDQEMAELRKSQSETDRSLRAFLDSLRKGGNGNSSS